MSRGEAARLTGTQDDEPDKVFIDLWLALASQRGQLGAVLAMQLQWLVIALTTLLSALAT